MGKQLVVGDRFRQRLRAERERRDWSQVQLAEKLDRRGVHGVYGSTIAKIESGYRSVGIDELNAFADIFGTSVDALMGRNTGGGDVMWAISKLTSSAQKIAAEVHGLRSRVEGEMQDVTYYAATDNQIRSVAELLSTADEALKVLLLAENALSILAGQFPLPIKG